MVGVSSNPGLCQEQDAADLLAFFTKHIRVPLPDYASLMVGTAAHGCTLMVLEQCKMHSHAAIGFICVLRSLRAAGCCERHAQRHTRG